jgi:hypothetical protein
MNRLLLNNKRNTTFNKTLRLEDRRGPRLQAKITSTQFGPTGQAIETENNRAYGALLTKLHAASRERKPTDI